MRPKTFVAFTAVTAVVTVAALAAVAGRYWLTPTRTDVQPFPGLVYRLGEVAEITIRRADGAVTMTRSGDDWQMAEKHGYPVRGDRVRQLAIGLAEMRLTERKTVKPERYPRLEVEDPGSEDAKSRLVTLRTADGAELAQIIVGRETSVGGDKGAYVRLPGQDQAWWSPVDLELGKTVEGWLQERIVHVAPDRISRLSTVHPDGETMVVYRDSPGDEHFKIKDLPEDAVLKNETAADGAASALTAVSLVDVAPDSEFDFSGDGVTRTEIATFDGLRLTLDMVEKDDETWARFSASRAPGSAGAAGEGASGAVEAEVAEINARVGGWAYKLSGWHALSFKPRMAHFLEKQELPEMP